MKQNHYTYPAIFSYYSNGISVEFPDLVDCFAFGETQEEALERAKEAMALHLSELEKGSFDIPTATLLNKVKIEANQATVLVDVSMPNVKQEMHEQLVNEILSTPRWLISRK